MLHTTLQNKELKKVITQKPLKAINKGSEARCGATNCNHKLGEFDNVSGMIKCSKCGCLNVVKK
jgi:hypothetical protein